MHNRNLTILAIFKVHSSVVLNAFTFLCHHRHQRRNFFLDLFMYYFCLHWVLITAPGLSPVAESRGSSLVVVRGLLVAVASLTVEKGSRHTGFSRSVWAHKLWCTNLGALRHSPRPGIKLVSPALAGGFFTIEPLGSPRGETFTAI